MTAETNKAETALTVAPIVLLICIYFFMSAKSK